MKKFLASILVAAMAFTGVSCTTTYDAYGNPQSSVDPGVAIAGAVAAGVIGHAIASKRQDRYHRSHRRGNYHRGGYGYYDRRGRYHRY